VGGLYGVIIGKAYFGESMFHRETDASKIALIFLVQFLKENGFKLLDTQYINNHLLQFGAIEIPNVEYEEMLAQALEGNCNSLIVLIFSLSRSCLMYYKYVKFSQEKLDESSDAIYGLKY